MGRLIVLVLLVVVAVWLVRRALRDRSGATHPRERAESAGQLVRCAHCGVHLPRAEARAADGLLYCSEEHARLGKR
ncbi:MAG: PP0621 family protein [Burkholderiales bacterium]